MRLFDFDDPFFRPLWLRIVIVLFASGWGIFEFISDAPLWGTLFLAIAALAFRGFFITFNPRDPESSEDS